MNGENCKTEHRVPAKWLSAADTRSLLCDEVHVWRVSLDQTEEDCLRLERTLAEEETRRAARFRLHAHRSDYVVAHGALRTIIGGYLEVASRELQFSTGTRGKPMLAHPSGALQFNLAHSGRLALVAVARTRPVGVDIEAIRAETRIMPIAQRHFSPRETAALAELPEAARVEAFYRCWTRKEAFLKARGEGLLWPLDQFDVSVQPGAPPALLRIRNDPDEAARYSLHDVDAGPGYAAAVAALGRDWHPVLLDWLPGG